MTKIKNNIWLRRGVMDHLRKLAREGGTARDISVALTDKYGVEVSRNAVIGKMHREKIYLKANRHDRPRPVRKSKAAPPKAQAQHVGPPPPKPVTPEPTPMGDVGAGCLWIYGEPSDRNFCGHPTTSIASSWCAHHGARVWSPNYRKNKHRWFMRAAA